MIREGRDRGFGCKRKSGWKGLEVGSGGGERHDRHGFNQPLDPQWDESQHCSGHSDVPQSPAAAACSQRESRLCTERALKLSPHYMILRMI